MICEAKVRRLIETDKPCLHKLSFFLQKLEQGLAISCFFRSFAPMKRQTDTILTITGSDSTGESGVQADMKIIHQMGGRAVSAITSITVQSSLGIQEFFDLPPQVVEGQIEAVVNDSEPQVVKVGMLRTVELVDVVVRLLTKYRPRYVVYDPIVHSSRGDELMSEAVVAAVRRHLLPLCSYVVEHNGPSAHGQANLFASAVCFYLSQGSSLADAVGLARDYVARQPVSNAEQTGRPAELYHLFLDHVERFYLRYNDVAFYAEQLNVSSRYLDQVTRRVCGRSPKAIIEERLLAELTHELLATRKPLKELAQRFGFSSQAHLARFFRQQKGLSPSEFRKQMTVSTSFP